MPAGKSRNSFGIRYVTDGPPNLMEMLNQMLDALDSLKPQISNDIFPLVTRQGTLLRLRTRQVQQTAGGSGGASGPYPFDCTFGPGSDSDHRALQIRPGTINGLIPTNYADEPDILAVGVYYLVLSVDVADGEVTGCTLSADGSPPAGLPVEMGQPPTSFDYLLGVIIDAVWIRVIGPGSLSAAAVEAFRVSKTAPAPGTLPYDIYYTWNLTA